MLLLSSSGEDPRNSPVAGFRVTKTVANNCGSHGRSHRQVRVSSELSALSAQDPIVYQITSRIKVRNARIEPSAGTPIGGTLNSHLNQELAAFGESSRA